MPCRRWPASAPGPIRTDGSGWAAARPETRASWRGSPDRSGTRSTARRRDPMARRRRRRGSSWAAVGLVAAAVNVIGGALSTGVFAAPGADSASRRRDRIGYGLEAVGSGRSRTAGPDHGRSGRWWRCGGGYRRGAAGGTDGDRGRGDADLRRATSYAPPRVVPRRAADRRPRRWTWAWRVETAPPCAHGRLRRLGRGRPRAVAGSARSPPPGSGRTMARMGTAPTIKRPRMPTIARTRQKKLDAQPAKRPPCPTTAPVSYLRLKIHDRDGQVLYVGKARVAGRKRVQSITFRARGNYAPRKSRPRSWSTGSRRSSSWAPAASTRRCCWSRT